LQTSGQSLPNRHWYRDDIAARLSAMSKFREFIDSLKAAGVVHSDSGTAIHVSSNGTTTASAGALNKVIRDRFQDMRAGPQQAIGRADDTKKD
jgi:hypothetical protein